MTKKEREKIGKDLSEGLMERVKDELYATTTAWNAGSPTSTGR